MTWGNLNTIKIYNFVLFVLLLLSACKQQPSSTLEINDMPLKSIPNDGLKPFKIATWVHGQTEFKDSLWNSKLQHYQQVGISAILVQASPDFLQQLVPVAQSYNIEVHAWMWTLNQPGNQETQQHPDWYSVNRKGQNSLEYRPYVNYYQWLSPFHPDACNYIIQKAKAYTAVKGLASVHLDYVRYVDVILGADLQPKYNLVQDKELPAFDFGYHPIACEAFKDLFGQDPMKLKHPELSTEWRQFRLNAVTNLVNRIADSLKVEGVSLTAAVFPFPEMSRQMVRQAWDAWNLDAAYPMLYHNFYQQNIKWIGFAAQQGVALKRFPIHAGLYMPSLKNPEDLWQALIIAKENGCAGACLFTADGMTLEQDSVVQLFSKQYIQKEKVVQ